MGHRSSNIVSEKHYHKPAECERCGSVDYVVNYSHQYHELRTCKQCGHSTDVSYHVPVLTLHRINADAREVIRKAL